MSKKLSTESYKGVRDFYPEDQALLNYIFSTMRSVVERAGYVEYPASVLGPVAYPHRLPLRAPPARPPARALAAQCRPLWLTKCGRRCGSHHGRARAYGRLRRARERLYHQGRQP